MGKPVQKTPQQLADEHWEWIEGVIFTQMKLTMRLFKDGFVHGYKHGKEIDEYTGPTFGFQEVRTKPRKK